MPERVQMTRHRPWRPEHPDAVIVDRRTRWGNPFRAPDWQDRAMARSWAVEQFRAWLRARNTGALTPVEARITYPDPGQVRGELAGRDLACWCPLGQPCHADVLLAVAAGQSP